MTDPVTPVGEAVATLREELGHLRSRRRGCPDPTCGLCKRYADDDVTVDAALAALAAELSRLTASHASLERRHVELGAEADARIAALEAELAASRLTSSLFARGQVDGELGEAIATLRAACHPYGTAVDTVLNEAVRARMRPALAAAERWAALRWRDPETAPQRGQVLAVSASSIGIAYAFGGSWVWSYRVATDATKLDGSPPPVLGWLPLDALPPPTEPAREEPKT